MRARSPIVPILPAALACALLLGACFGSSPPSRFYVLSSVPGKAAVPDAPAGGMLVVGPVTLPPEIDRPQLVTRLSPYERRVNETARWAAPLDEHVARVVAENLSARLSARRVAVAPTPSGTVYERRVAIDIVAFDAVPGGKCTLSARWTLFDSGGKVLSSLHTTVDSATDGADPQDIVAAMSGCLATLCDAIALAVATVVEPTGG
jgi:hypothetical protein